MRMKLTFKTVIFILIIILIFYLKFRVGIHHEIGPESIVNLFQ